MSLNLTHGYDMVLRLKSDVLNEFFWGAYRSMPGRRGHLNLPELGGQVPFEFEFYFPERQYEIPPILHTYVSSGQLEENQVRLDLPFMMNLGDYDGFIGWILDVRPKLLVNKISDQRHCVEVDFTDCTEFEIKFYEDLQHFEEVPLPNDLHEHESEVKRAMIDMLITHLSSEVSLQTHDLCFEIDPPYAAHPLRLQEVDLIVAANVDSVYILLTTGGGQAGDRSAFDTTSLTPDWLEDSTGAVQLVIGNDLLLRRLICQRFVAELGLSGAADDFFDFDGAEATLREPVDIDHMVSHDRVDNAALNSFHLIIADGLISITGNISLSGVGWTGTCPLDGYIMVDEVTDEGPVLFRTVISEGSVEVKAKPWVWVAGILSPGLLSGIWGSLAMTTNYVANEVLEPSLTETLDDLLPEPDSPTISVIPFDHFYNIFLDDLTIYGRPRISEPPEYRGPEVRITGELEVMEVRGSDTEHLVLWNVVTIIKTNFDKAHHGVFQACSSRLLTPFEYYWSLDKDEDKQPLEGEGSINVQDAEIRFSTQGDRCELWLDMGDSLDAELKVVVKDARGVKAEDKRRLTAEGSRPSLGVSGDEIIMGPIVDIFQTEPKQVIHELASLGLIASDEPGPDESESEVMGLGSHSKAFHAALLEGMGMEELPDMPFEG